MDEEAGVVTAAATGVPVTLVDAVLCEFGMSPVIAATPVRLTSMTEMAAPATSGWIRFDALLLSIATSCDMDLFA
jgi:hypothetical protein